MRVLARILPAYFSTLSNGATFGAGDTLSSSIGTAINIASSGSYTVGPAGGVNPTVWGFGNGGSVGKFTLNDLGPVGGGPDQTIVGPSNNGTYTGGNYSNANASITGNGPHNPFLESGAMFNLTIPGLTAGNYVTSVTFQFGTTYANELVVGAPVPEPGTWAAGALALVGLLATQRGRIGRLLKRV